jgi:hypothetical protein
MLLKLFIRKENMTSEKGKWYSVISSGALF